MLFGAKYCAPRSIVEFDYKVGQTRNLLIMNDPKRQATLIRQMAGYITEQGLDPTWVATHMEPIVKSLLSFLAKFQWAIVRSLIWPILAENTLIPEHVILDASILVGYDIDWASNRYMRSD